MASSSDSGSATPEQAEPSNEIQVTYKFRDKNRLMVIAWEEMFGCYSDRIQITQGDIFKGAPSADAIVSPANSFGFMDGGIDAAYSLHFGWQMQERVQKIIREQHNGELLVGDAIVIPTFEGGAEESSMCWTGFNESKPIKYLISAPTMRVPQEVPDTVNAYLAFRAVILAVRKHNKADGVEPIRTVLCPGLATAVGRMPQRKAAFQMLRAFESYDLCRNMLVQRPTHLEHVWVDHMAMAEFGDPDDQLPLRRRGSKKVVEKTESLKE